MSLLVVGLVVSCAKTTPTAPFPVLTREILAANADGGSLTLTEGNSLTVSIRFEKALSFDTFVNFEVQGGIGRFLKPIGAIEVKKGTSVASVLLESYINDVIEGTQTINVVFSSEALEESVTIPITMVDPTTAAVLSFTVSSPVNFPTMPINVPSEMELNLTNTGDVAASQLQVPLNGLPAPFQFKGGVYPGAGGSCGTSLKANESCRLILEATLATSGTETKTFQISYNDGSMDKTLSLDLVMKSDSVVSTIDGVPESLSALKFMNVTVAGLNVTNYKFKVGAASSTSCADATGYSTTQSVATKITSNITAVADGQMLLCVVGYSTVDNKWQDYASATFYNWIKDTNPPSSPTISINVGASSTNLIITQLQLFAGGAKFMYVTNVEGCNSGSSWELYAEGKTWVLNAPDVLNTVYVKYRDRLGNETACISDTIVHDQAEPTLIIEQESTQPDPTLTLPVVFRMKFSEPVNEDFMTNLATIVEQKGTATDVVWAVEKINSTQYFLRATQVGVGGTIVPEVASGKIFDVAGNGGSASNISYDHAINFNIVEFYTNEVYLGEDFSCATSSDAKSYCWGNNDQGQLGLGSNSQTEALTPSAMVTSLPDPLLPAPPAGFRKLSLGYDSACGVARDGRVYCWGSCAQGKTAQGIHYAAYCTTFHNSPQLIRYATWPNLMSTEASQEEFADVAVGKYHGCALRRNGQVVCWGETNEGQRGNNRDYTAIVPRKYVFEVEYPITMNAPTGLYDFKALTAGDFHTCGLSGNGSVWCWGRGDEGQLGNNTVALSMVPSKVVTVDYGDFSGFIQVSAGANFTCGVEGKGRVYCWGENSFGQLGNNSTVTAQKPVLVDTSFLTGQITFVEVKAGREHACGRTSGGEIYCWGRSANGRLGADYGDVNQLTPVVVQLSGSPIRNAISLDVHGSHSCYISSDGKLSCWGKNNKGQLGVNTTADSALPLSSLFGNALSPKSFKDIAAGVSNTCAIDQGGRLFCWGNGLDGRNGNGIESHDKPVEVSRNGVTSGLWFVQVSGSGNHHCALTSDGKPFCWGKNTDGQLGEGTTNAQSYPYPVDISGITPFLGFRQISAGKSHTCALHGDGKMYCWGYGFFGQLGRGTTTSSVVPVAVDSSGIIGVFSQVASGALHTCGATPQGLGYCWGNAGSGRLGANTLQDRLYPSQVQASSFPATSKIKGIYSGGSHSCVILTGDGGGWCWGAGNDGQLGNSGNLGKQVPALVTYPAASGTFIKMELGESHSCATNHRGGLLCWGEGAYGKIGDGVFLTRNSPSPISFTPTVIDGPQYPNYIGSMNMSGGEHHTCVVGLAGDTYCWGSAIDGRLGVINQLIDVGTPMKVSDP